MKTSMYSVNKVRPGYTYYLHMLEEKCLNMYTYTGLPESLPALQIESRLIWNGYGIVFQHEKEGLVIVSGGLSGVDKYYLPTRAVWAQPALGSGNLLINKDCIILYNSKIDKYSPYGYRLLIKRTARLLADIDSSINIVTINSRMQKMNVVTTQQTARTVDEAMHALYAGEPYTINQNSMLDTYKTVDWFDSTNSASLETLLAAKQTIMSNFLQEIGIRSVYEKSERLVADEVFADLQFLNCNTADQLETRQEGIKQINAMFGANIVVTQNENFVPMSESINDLAETKLNTEPGEQEENNQTKGE